MNDTPPIIESKSLTRTFRQTKAVDGLDLSIRRGEIFGLVGPDGAGKTTILRLLAGLLDITEGSLTVDGHDLASDAEAVKAIIGYMAQQFSLYSELTVRENLAFFADIFNVMGEVRQERVRRLMTFARLTEFEDRRAAHLSGGMQKKLALACTLIHEPKILLLDEPTTGVDPVSRREFWDILTDLHMAGTTIVISTPYMDEADRCSRVGLIYGGRLVICDQPRKIREMVEGEIIEFRPEDWRRTTKLIEGLPGVLEVQTYGEMLHVFLDSVEERLPFIEATLRDAEISYRGLRRAPARMEEAFISLIRGMDSPETT
ncbi:MAG: ABC transporter ATP-binding protein [Anaerolineaceae bacterium]|nr:MAG: ABC transporter ATP-binding protein [Anaerolineaceae bacterium]